LLFIVRVNRALAQLGIDPRTFNVDFKVGLMTAGKVSGNSPQEVAIWLVSQLPITHRFGLNPFVVKTWIRKRKINPRLPEMKEALISLGWEEFLDY
jgi:hypothetical protein